MVGRLSKPKDRPRTLMVISCQAAVSMVESLELLVQELGVSHSQGGCSKGPCKRSDHWENTSLKGS